MQSPPRRRHAASPILRLEQHGDETSPPCPSGGGFTLVEIMFAVAISSMLIMAMGVVIRNASTSMDAMQLDVSLEAKIRSILSQINTHVALSSRKQYTINVNDINKYAFDKSGQITSGGNYWKDVVWNNHADRLDYRIYLELESSNAINPYGRYGAVDKDGVNQPMWHYRLLVSVPAPDNPPSTDITKRTLYRMVFDDSNNTYGDTDGDGIDNLAAAGLGALQNDATLVRYTNLVDVTRDIDRDLDGILVNNDSSAITDETSVKGFDVRTSTGPDNVVIYLRLRRENVDLPGGVVWKDGATVARFKNRLPAYIRSEAVYTAP